MMQNNLGQKKKIGSREEKKKIKTLQSIYVYYCSVANYYCIQLAFNL